MSKFLILSESGSGVGLALRLGVEGHEVRLKVFDSDYDGIGRGLVEDASKYFVGQTVVADCVGFGHVLELFRDSGVKILAGGVFADQLEGDRKLSEAIMRDAGIDTPAAVSVSSWEDASKKAAKFADKYGKVVLKPEGALSGLVPSFVASDAEDAQAWLKQQEKHSSEMELTVQEYLKGVPVSTEGWFNGEEWVEGMFNHTIERKHFLAGDHGPSTGCVGNLVWPCDSLDPLVTQTLTKLTDVLRKHNYVGPIDINCVANKEGLYGLEFTPRFGYDAFPTLLHSLAGFDFGGFLGSVADGRNTDVALTQGFGAGIRIGLPPWPSERFHGEAGVPIRGFEKEDEPWFYPYEVQQVDGQLRTSKGFGILGVINGFGSCIGEAFARAYEIVSRLKVPDLQYRVDLTQACLKDYRELLSIMGEGSEGWIGVDLDGTLAEYSGWSAKIGEPVEKMVKRVKRWVADGEEVRIFTARGNFDGKGEEARFKQLVKIYEWVNEHIGTPLEVTCEKDPFMKRLYDDRARQVEEGTGVLVGA